MSLIHATQSTTLDDYRVAIEHEVDRMVMRVGEILWAAKRAHPKDFDAWVEHDLPFGKDTAKRLMAIHRAYKELPPETIARLPRPWQAMFALRNVPRDELEAAMDRGEIGPGTTVKGAIAYAQGREGPGPAPRRADMLAGALLGHDPSELDPIVRAELVAWAQRDSST